jgi:hypothetical protein
MAKYYMRRAAAADYAKERYGEAAAPSEGLLAKLASKGGGPIYYRFGRTVGYLPEDIDAWIAARARRVGSTSEVG